MASGLLLFLGGLPPISGHSTGNPLVQRHAISILSPREHPRTAHAVSERPLITAAIMARTNAQMPFASLTTPEISDLVETLATEAPNAWSAGTLSFLVG